MLARLEGYAHRALIMAPVVVVLMNVWRGQPYPMAHAVNAAGVMAIILALAAFRMAPREVVATALVLLVGACAATLATATGEGSNVARVFIGGLFVVTAWTTWAHRRDALDTALAAGLWSEVAMWAIGNAGRGTFGADVAFSAIGSAHGAWAQPAQWLLIVAAYGFAWYNLKANRT